jgi:hypothetical protein
MIQDMLQAKSAADLHSVHSVQDHIKYITMAENLLDFGSQEISTTSPEVLTVRIFLRSLGISGSENSQA